MIEEAGRALHASCRKRSRKDEARFLLDLIERVQDARPDLVSEGELLQASNIAKRMFERAELRQQLPGVLRLVGEYFRPDGVATGEHPPRYYIFSDEFITMLPSWLPVEPSTEELDAWRRVMEGTAEP